MAVVAHLGFLDDAWEVVEDFGGAVVDVVEGAADIVSEVPGIDKLIEVTGDFVDTAVGQTVLRAIATTMTGGLALYVGPQLASVAFAFPGLMRGEDFDEAWLQEFAWRVEKTAEIVGADFLPKVGEEVVALFERAWAELGPEIQQLANESIEDLAKRFGVREDIAAQFRALIRREFLHPSEKFDPYTGKRITVSSAVRQGFSASIPRTTTVYQNAKSAQIGKASTSISASLARASSTMRISQPASVQPSPPEVVRAVSPHAEQSSALPNALVAVGVVGALGAIYWWYRS